MKKTQIGMKLFSATTFAQRRDLGDRVTEWLSTQPRRLYQRQVLQSSDSAFHCITIILIWES